MEKKEKILFYSQIDTVHTLWKEMINSPPKGYEFIINKSEISINQWVKLKKIPLINWIYRNLLYRIINPMKLSKKFSKIGGDIKLVYAPEVTFNGNIPWVCDLEESLCFGGNNEKLFEATKKSVQKSFESPLCRKIMPFTNFAKESLEREFDTSKFKNKIEVVRFGASMPKIKSKKTSKFVDIIFVGTANQTDSSIFNLKGGREAIEAFRTLSKKYSNLRMTMISNIPAGIDINIPRLKILPLMDRKELFKLYSESDIFLAPCYFGLGMTIVEALGCSLPLVCTDMYAMPEAVTNNGLLINVKNRGKYRYRGPPSYEFVDFMNFIHKHNGQDIVDGIIKNISFLVENPKLRRKMGIASRKKFEKEFSTEIRNKKLKRIFDEALKNQ